MTMFLQESKMKISLAVIAISGCLIGMIDALRCYDCKDRTEAEQGTPDDKNVYGRCSEEGQADCEEGKVCVSLFFEGYAVVTDFFDPDQEIIFTRGGGQWRKMANNGEKWRIMAMANSAFSFVKFAIFRQFLILEFHI